MRLMRFVIATSVLPYCRRYAANAACDCWLYATILLMLCGLGGLGLLALCYHIVAAMRLTLSWITGSMLPYCRRYAANAVWDYWLYATILLMLCGLGGLELPSPFYHTSTALRLNSRVTATVW